MSTEKIESFIEGSEKLTNIFGYWPTFHDAEVIELHLSRGFIDPEQEKYVFPMLSMTVHLWELTNESDASTFLVRRNHTLVKMRFIDVDKLEMQGFNHQNAMLSMNINWQTREEGPSPYFSVHIHPAHGMGATFECLRIHLSEAVECDEDGRAIEGEFGVEKEGGSKKPPSSSIN